MPERDTETATTETTETATTETTETATTETRVPEGVPGSDLSSRVAALEDRIAKLEATTVRHTPD